jgi:hypothetical protein
MQKSIRRPSPALIVAIVALVAALAGTAVALPGKNTVSSNDIKKNAVRSSDIKNDKVKGVDVKESSLGQVPSAAHADGSAALDNLKWFNVNAPEDSITSLVKTADFELMGDCDANGDFAVPSSIVDLEYNGSQTLSSTTLVIVRRGATPAFSDTDDDEDFALETGEGVAFNYQDNGDGGGAVDTAGHYMFAPDFLNILSDSTYVNSPGSDDDSPFGSNCHFQGAAFVG